jgi:hypothetical protein
MIYFDWLAELTNYTVAPTLVCSSGLDSEAPNSANAVTEDPKAIVIERLATQSMIPQFIRIITNPLYIN